MQTVSHHLEMHKTRRVLSTLYDDDEEEEEEEERDDEIKLQKQLARSCSTRGERRDEM